MNIKSPPSTKKISRLLRTVHQLPRVRILLGIGRGEACVCHLEALLGYRQAYISQHLMALRKAKLLATRREGRYIFYRLRDPELLDLICQAGVVAGVPATELEALTQDESLPQCICPDCGGESKTGVELTSAAEVPQ
ncbi:MAG: metalloregulator ArsR/SmtB family transcription factor [Anaerolineales bacterium]|jgi:ArsR family transcriptional regulator